MTIRIPQTNQLNDAGSRSQSARTFSGISRHFSEHFRRTPWHLTFGYRLQRCQNRRELIRLGSSAPPEPPLTQREGITLLIEQVELRDLIHSVRSLLRRVADRSDAHKQIGFWLTSFEKVADAAHPSLRVLPAQGRDIPADFQLAVAPKQLLEARPRLVLAAVDLIRLLTSPQPHAESTCLDAKHRDSGAG